MAASRGLQEMVKRKEGRKAGEKEGKERERRSSAVAFYPTTVYKTPCVPDD